MTENQRAGPVALLGAQWHFCLRQYFFNKKTFLVLYLFWRKKVNNRKIRVKFTIFKMIDSKIYHAKCNRISLEIAQILMARLPCLTRYRSWVPMSSYTRLLWSDFCNYVFLLLFSLSVFSDRRSLKIENENNNRKPTVEASYIGLKFPEFSL